MADKVIVTIITDSTPEGNSTIIFIGSQIKGLSLARDLAPNLRDFKESDYRCFGVTLNLPSGNLPKICETDNYILIVSGI